MPSEEDLDDENSINYDNILEMEEYKEKLTKQVLISMDKQEVTSLKQDELIPFVKELQIILNCPELTQEQIDQVHQQLGGKEDLGFDVIKGKITELVWIV